MRDDHEVLFSVPVEPIPEIPGPRPRVGVLASGAGSNLEALARSRVGGALGVELVGLVCNVEGAGALEVARRHGLAATCLPHALRVEPGDTLRMRCRWRNTSEEVLGWPEEMCVALMY